MNIEEKVLLRRKIEEVRSAARTFGIVASFANVDAVYDAANLLCRLAGEVADICMPAVTEDSDDK